MKLTNLKDRIEEIREGMFHGLGAEPDTIYYSYAKELLDILDSFYHTEEEIERICKEICKPIATPGEILGAKTFARYLGILEDKMK